MAELALEIVPNSSLDLIFGWAGQTLAGWERDVEIALELASPHISTYQLTIEPGTAFAKAEGRGKTRAVGSELSADMYEVSSAALEAAGYAHYEVSNFAKGSVARSQHNLAYWRGWDYVGAGPGAHGRITTGEGRLATVMPLRPGEYAENPEPEVERMSAADVVSERVMMGLRTDEGVAADEVGGWPDLSDLSEWVTVREGRAVATRAGRRVLNTVSTEILMRLEEGRSN